MKPERASAGKSVMVFSAIPRQLSDVLRFHFTIFPNLPALIAPITAALIIAVAAVLAGCGAGESGEGPIASSDLSAEALIARGEYLATAGNCASCHTAPGGVALAGGLPFRTPFGVIYSTNITPHEEHGIGRWSDWDFLNSMRYGLRPGGEHLYPVFPYTHFTRVTNDDLLAIYAYLQTVDPVPAANFENTVAFPFSQRSLMAVWKALFFSPGIYKERPEESAAWNRGAYLVEGLAHCSACHSPRNPLGAEDVDLAMSGGVYVDRVGDEGLHRPWSAPNLTASPRGLGLWSQESLSAYLHTARNDFVESFGPMNEVIMNSTRHLSASDVDAMATYLKSLPAVDEERGPAPDRGLMGRGRTVYNLHCGTCHLPTGLGDPEMGPRLDEGSLVVQAADPASLINVILYSPEAPHPALPDVLPDALPKKWRKPMEEFQYVLDDDEVAAVATFIRNSWNNSAGIVQPEQVARQR